MLMNKPPPMPDLIPEDDPLLQAELKRVLGPLEERMPKEVLKTMRETLIDILTTHPTGVRLMAKARKAALAKESGDRAKRDGTPVTPGEQPSDKDKKGSPS